MLLEYENAKYRHLCARFVKVCFSGGNKPNVAPCELKNKNTINYLKVSLTSRIQFSHAHSLEILPTWSPNHSMAQLHGRLSDDTRVCIGVLCLQGSFSEHVGMLKRIPGVQTSEVRLPSDLEGLDGLIFPGGESTSMAIVGESTGIFPALKEWTARYFL